MTTYVTDLNGLVRLQTAAAIRHELRLSCTAEIDLGALSDSIRNTLRKGLERGYLAATKGKAWTIYNLLAEKWQFPVVAFGTASGQFNIDLPESVNSEVWNDLITLQKLTKGRYYPAARYSNQYRTLKGYNRWWASKPPGMTLNTVLHMLKINHIRELVPKEPQLAAMSALLSGELVSLNLITRE